MVLFPRSVRRGREWLAGIRIDALPGPLPEPNRPGENLSMGVGVVVVSASEPE
jgi:hypothetical protein